MVDLRRYARGLALIDRGISTIDGLFDAANAMAVNLPDTPSGVAHSVYKRHLLVYMKTHFPGVRLDFGRMRRDGITQMVGMFPNQMLVLGSNDDLNRGLSDEVALGIALRASQSPAPSRRYLPAATPSQFERSIAPRHSPASPPVSAGQSATEEYHPVDNCAVSRITPEVPAPPSFLPRVSSILSDEPPEDLLCPLTLDLYDDPVRTACGQIYERAAITEWFSKGETTDPMTGLMLENLRRDPLMWLRCVIFRNQKAAWTMRDMPRAFEQIMKPRQTPIMHTFFRV